MPHRLDCGLLHHAFRGRRGRSVGRSVGDDDGGLDDITRCHSLSECLVCFTLRQLLVLLPVGCRVESLCGRWLTGHGWLAKACRGLCGRTRKGGGRGRTAQVAPRTTDDQAHCVRGRSILGRLSQLPSMWSWKEELSASFSHNHANLPLLSTASTTVQSGHYQQVAATAAILVEIKSSLEWVQGIWDWLFSADRLVICVRRGLTRPFPFFLVANCEPGCGLIIKVRPWKVADTLVKKSKLAGCPWQINEHVLLLL